MSDGHEVTEKIDRATAKREVSEARLVQLSRAVEDLERPHMLALARACFQWSEATSDEVVEAMGDDDVLVERLIATAHKRMGAERWNELIVASLSNADLELHMRAVERVMAARRRAEPTRQTARLAQRATVPEQVKQARQARVEQRREQASAGDTDS